MSILLSFKMLFYVVAVTVVCVRVYFRVSDRYLLIYDCLQLGMISFGSLSRTQRELRASPPESSQRML